MQIALLSGATERLANAAKLGRVAAQRPEARAKHVASRRRHAQACSAWDASMQPGWLTSELFSQKIQPKLSDVATSVIRSSIGVSRWYASRIRQGYRPHPRHWLGSWEFRGMGRTTELQFRAQRCRCSRILCFQKFSINHKLPFVVQPLNAKWRPSGEGRASV